MIWLFPLIFASSAFVPTATMPAGLRAFANDQPITKITDAVRGWFLGTPVALERLDRGGLVRRDPRRVRAAVGAGLPAGGGEVLSAASPALVVMAGGDHEREHDAERGGEDDQHRDAAQVGAVLGGSESPHRLACGDHPTLARSSRLALTARAHPRRGARRARARRLRLERAAGRSHATLVLDFVPNAVHAGIYRALAAGYYRARRDRPAGDPAELDLDDARS